MKVQKWLFFGFLLIFSACQHHGKQENLKLYEKNQLYKSKIAQVNQARKAALSAHMPRKNAEKYTPKFIAPGEPKVKNKPMKKAKTLNDRDNKTENIGKTPSLPQRDVKKKVRPKPSFMKYLTGPVEVDDKFNNPKSLAPPPGNSDSIRVALLLPLTGPNKEIGHAMLNAAQLALFDFADLRFELLVYDTRGEVSGAQVSAQESISDGVALIIGPLLAKCVEAAAVAARAANIPIIAFSNDYSLAGDGVFVFGFMPEAQVNKVVEYAWSKGITRYAVFAPNNKYGENIVRALRVLERRLGLEISKTQYYNPYAKDFSADVKSLGDYDKRRRALLKYKAVLENEGGELAKKSLKRLVGVQTMGNLPFEALLVADGGNRLKSIAALLPFYGIDPKETQILGTGQWDESGIGKEPALSGGWFAAPPPQSRNKFELNYKRLFKKEPPRLVTLAYDATALSASLAKSQGLQGLTITALTSPGGFLGRDGLFRLLQSGITDRGLAVLEVGAEKNKILQSAPRSFEETIN